MKTYDEIIDETVAFYSEDTSRRALDDGEDTCLYKTSDGRNCALGRLADPEKLEELYAKENGSEPMFADVLKILKPEYVTDTAIGECFYADLQHLHDGSDYWDENGLTEYGVEYVENFKLRCK